VQVKALEASPAYKAERFDMFAAKVSLQAGRAKVHCAESDAVVARMLDVHTLLARVSIGVDVNGHAWRLIHASWT
jgi:hypothetical protein